MKRESEELEENDASKVPRIASEENKRILSRGVNSHISRESVISRGATIPSSSNILLRSANNHDSLRRSLIESHKKSSTSDVQNVTRSNTASLHTTGAARTTAITDFPLTTPNKVPSHPSLNYTGTNIVNATTNYTMLLDKNSPQTLLAKGFNLDRRIRSASMSESLVFNSRTPSPLTVDGNQLSAFRSQKGLKALSNHSLAQMTLGNDTSQTNLHELNDLKASSIEDNRQPACSESSATLEQSTNKPFAIQHSSSNFHPLLRSTPVLQRNSLYSVTNVPRGTMTATQFSSHHSAYETISGSAVRKTQQQTSQLNNDRDVCTRPAITNLPPRKKSNSESTLSRYVDIEGSSARSRGLATFSALGSGYQPVSTASSSTVATTGNNIAEMTPRLEPVADSSSSSTAPVRTNTVSPNDGIVPEISQMNFSWTSSSRSTHQSTVLNLILNSLVLGMPNDEPSPLLQQDLRSNSQFASWLKRSFEQHSLRVDRADQITCDTAKATSSNDSQIDGLNSILKKNYMSLVKKAGPYILGPRIGSSPVRCIVQCLARKEKTNKFYIIKILTLADPDKETMDDRQGKMLMLTEFSLLSHLQNSEGVVHCIDFFKDKAWDSTEKCEINRLCLVLDCLIPHDYDPESHYFVNLQHHVIHEKKLNEKEALIIFWDIARIVENLHQKNIVHRDLKLGNMIVDRRSWRVTITNFCLGRHLNSEKDKLRDQRGSPAYISPDVLSGKPYYGKPSDMWALGVVLFTMLYGQFPFYDCLPQELFRKIKSAEFTIPNDGRVSEDTKQLIQQLITLDPQTRMTAGQVVDALKHIIGKWKVMMTCDTDQVVPDIPTVTVPEFQHDDNQKMTQTETSEDLPLIDFQNCQLQKTSNLQIIGHSNYF
ncbi:chitinase protein PB1E7.04c [Biomphalaria glabrata]|nr:chitinase protein PB1E7.04c [Biomphalaria glabrata]